MTGDLILNNTIRLMSQKLDLTPVELIKVLADDTMHLNLQALDLKVGGWVDFSTTAPTTNHQPIDVEDLTRKDYVDTKLPLAGGTVTGQIKGIPPIAPEDLANKGYIDSRIHLLDGAAIGMEFTIYGSSRNIPGFAVPLDGRYYSKVIFSELYSILGDDWNTVFGQVEPPTDYFRVPVSQDLLLYSLDEDGNSNMGTYHYNSIINRVSPIKCIWTSYRVERKTFVNDDFEAYAVSMSGFTRNVSYENLDFELTAIYSVGFGIAQTFNNTDFTALASYIQGFANHERYGNTDFTALASYIQGFANHERYGNTDFTALASYIQGFANHENYGNTDFSINVAINNGFIF